MKNLIYIPLLVITVACHRAQINPTQPDLATILSGSWKVEDCRTLANKPGGCTGSLVLSRIDATRLHGDFKLSTGSSFSDTCKITIADKDTLFGMLGSPGYYRQGKIQMSFGDASMNVRFTKE